MAQIKITHTSNADMNIGIPKQITMAQQTAIQWLENNLIGNPHFEEDFRHNRKIFEQAKQIEKEQIIEDFINGSQWSIFPDDTPIDKIAEQYYNETYGK